MCGWGRYHPTLCEHPLHEKLKAQIVDKSGFMTHVHLSVWRKVTLSHRPRCHTSFMKTSWLAPNFGHDFTIVAVSLVENCGFLFSSCFFSYVLFWLSRCLQIFTTQGSLDDSPHLPSESLPAYWCAWCANMSVFFQTVQPNEVPSLTFFSSVWCSNAR